MKKYVLQLLLISVISSYSQTVTDYEGNIYSTIEIGTQIWMAEDLKTQTFNNGIVMDELPEGHTVNWYLNTTFPFYSDIFGNHILYNWFAASNPNICPTGWRVPSDVDWGDLESYLSTHGHFSTEGKALKSTNDWVNDGNGTDDFGFNAKPRGMLNSTSTSPYSVFGSGEYGFWWSSTQATSNFAYGRLLISSSSNDIYQEYADKQFRYCVRCMKDSPALGVNENDELVSIVNAYPNPSSNYINIQNNNITDITLVQVFSLTGEKVIEREFKAGLRGLKINIGNLSSGTYIYVVNGVSQKFVKK